MATKVSKYDPGSVIIGPSNPDPLFRITDPWIKIECNTGFFYQNLTEKGKPKKCPGSPKADIQYRTAPLNLWQIIFPWYEIVLEEQEKKFVLSIYTRTASAHKIRASKSNPLLKHVVSFKMNSGRISRWFQSVRTIIFFFEQLASCCVDRIFSFHSSWGTLPNLASENRLPMKQTCSSRR